MVNESFTAQQWVDYFFDKLDNRETVTVNDLLEAVKTVSVKDPIAGKDALTIFYSGEGSSFPKGLSETAGSRVRMIDYTEAYKFLSHERFDELLENVIVREYEEAGRDSNVLDSIKERILYPGSKGSVAEGTWTASDVLVCYFAQVCC